VIAIIATLAGLVGPSLFGNVGDGKQTAARAQLEVFALALDSYRLDVGEYPDDATALEGLVTPPQDADRRARWRGPYLRRALPTDPWNRPWQYRSGTDRDPEGYVIQSLGRDGRAGGSGEDRDISSEPIEVTQ
jgi:general secretion pathway protein G